MKKDHAKPRDNNNPQPKGARIILVGDSTNNNQFKYDAASHRAKLVIVTDSNAYPYTISYQRGVPAKLQSPNFTANLYYNGGWLTRRCIKITRLITGQ